MYSAKFSHIWHSERNSQEHTRGKNYFRYHGEATEPHFLGSTYLLEIQICNKISKTTAEPSEGFCNISEVCTGGPWEPANNHAKTSKFSKGAFFKEFYISPSKKAHIICIDSKDSKNFIYLRALNEWSFSHGHTFIGKPDGNDVRVKPQ